MSKIIFKELISWYNKCPDDFETFLEKQPESDFKSILQSMKQAEVEKKQKIEDHKHDEYFEILSRDAYYQKDKKRFYIEEWITGGRYEEFFSIKEFITMLSFHIISYEICLEDELNREIWSMIICNYTCSNKEVRKIIDYCLDISYYFCINFKNIYYQEWRRYEDNYSYDPYLSDALDKIKKKYELELKENVKNTYIKTLKLWNLPKDLHTRVIKYI